MHAKLTIAAAVAGLAVLAAGPALARPYLMLSADEHGFQALDLQGGGRQPPTEIPATVEITVIDAPLAGAAYGDKLAPLVERRLEVSCEEARWRTLSTAYVDAHEAVLAQGEAQGAWSPFGDDVTAPVVQAAACRKQYRQPMVSRYLNIGEILANYQAARGRAVPQPQTREQLLAQRYKTGH